MKIKYNNVMDDIVEFTKCHYENSKTLKKQKITTFISAIFILSLIIGFSYYLSNNIEYVRIGVISSVIFLFLLHRGYSKGIIKTAKNSMKREV